MYQKILFGKVITNLNIHVSICKTNIYFTIIKSYFIYFINLFYNLHVRIVWLNN